MVIRSDSNYLIDALTSQYDKWLAKKFKNAKGNPIANKEQIKFTHLEVNAFIDEWGIDIEFEKIDSDLENMKRSKELANQVVDKYFEDGKEVIHIGFM